MGPAAQCPPADAPLGGRRPVFGSGQKPAQGRRRSVVALGSQGPHHGVKASTGVTQRTFHLVQIANLAGPPGGVEALDAGPDPFEGLTYRRCHRTQFRMLALHGTSVPDS